MNRREFLLGLLSVPFGWKALFNREENSLPVDSIEEIDDLEIGTGWGDGAGNEYWHPYGSGVPSYPFARWEWEPFPVCEVKPEIHHGQCEEMIEVDDARVDGIDAVTGRISNLADWGKESSFVCVEHVDDPPPIACKGIENERCIYLLYEDGHVEYCPDAGVSDPQWYPSDVWPARDDIVASDLAWHELIDDEWELIT